jgi:hypothetical protein
MGDSCCKLRAELLAVLLAALWAGAVRADLPPASSTRETKAEAEKHIPWNDLAGPQQQLVRELIDQSSVFRRLPTRVVDCDPQMFNFLAAHPEVVTDVWRLMGVGVLEVQPLGGSTFVARDSAGTTGKLTYLVEKYGENARNTLLIYGTGTYTGAPLPRNVDARCLMLVRSGSTVETNGRSYVTAVVDTWVVVDRVGAELIAKTLQPLMAKAADHNFTETMKFVSTFSRTAEHNPAGMGRLSAKLPSADDATRAELVQLSQQVADRYARLTAERAAVRVSQHVE